MAGKTKTKKVQFELLAPEALKVYLSGSFNNRDTSVNPMKRNKKEYGRRRSPYRAEKDDIVELTRR